MIPTVPTNVSAFTNDAGYLKEHQSLNDYYTKLEVDNQFTAIDKRMTDFDKGIDDLELIVSSSLNDINTRVETNLSTINSLLNKIDKLTQRVTALERKNTSAG